MSVEYYTLAFRPFCLDTLELICVLGHDCPKSPPQNLLQNRSYWQTHDYSDLKDSCGSNFAVPEGYSVDSMVYTPSTPT
jgi:hypothetical protein